MIKDFNYICGKILGISDALEMQGDDISKRTAEKLRECVSDLDLCVFGEWKDIKTAPKNHGAEFLVILTGELDIEVPNGIDDPVNGFYYGPDIYTVSESNKVTTAFVAVNPDDSSDITIFSDQLFQYDVDGLCTNFEGDSEMQLGNPLRLTHWMPLPNAPYKLSGRK